MSGGLAPAREAILPVIRKSLAEARPLDQNAYKVEMAVNAAVRAVLAAGGAAPLRSGVERFRAFFRERVRYGDEGKPASEAAPNLVVTLLRAQSSNVDGGHPSAQGAAYPDGAGRLWSLRG